MEELIARVFAARDAAHKEHLRTSSYAQHMALGAFYVDVIAAIDAAAEAYQGMFGKMEEYPEADKPEGEITEYLRDEVEWIEANRDILAGGSGSISNLIDVVSGVYLTAIYKLENLR